MERGISVFCPISHSHGIALRRGQDFNTHGVWLKEDKLFMDGAGGLIVIMMDGWSESYGVQFEITMFRNAGKPIFYLSWPELEIVG